MLLQAGRRVAPRIGSSDAGVLSLLSLADPTITSPEPSPSQQESSSSSTSAAPQPALWVSCSSHDAAADRQWRRSTCPSRHTPTSWARGDPTSAAAVQPHPHHSSRRSFSTSGSAHAAGAGGGGGLTPLEVLGMVASPSQLGASALELMHSSTGLPWWAAIPATAVAARAALLPLSLRARRAAGRLLLLDTALEQAKLLTLDLGPKDSQVLRRQRLVRTLYRSLQDKAQLPSLSWYGANALVQAMVLGIFTSGLGAMSSALWPGLAMEGPLGLKDLTSPPVFLGTLSTPFGTMGAVVPLLLLLAYVKSVDMSTAGKVAGLGVALRVLAAPLYVLSLLQPHSTLLYWLSHTVLTGLVHTFPGGAAPSLLRSSSAAGAAGAAPLTRADPELAVALAERFTAARPETKDSLRAAALCYDAAVRELQKEIAAVASPLSSANTTGQEQQAQGSPATAAGAAATVARDEEEEVGGAAADPRLEARVVLLASAQRALDEVLERSAAAGWPQEPLVHLQSAR